MIKFCSLYSGSSGNSIYLGTESTHILVDAGVSGIRIAKALGEINVNPEDVCAILITHEHSDHIKGAGVFSRKYNVPIFARKKTWVSMRRELGTLPDNNIRPTGKKEQSAKPTTPHTLKKAKQNEEAPHPFPPAACL